MAYTRERRPARGGAQNDAHGDGIRARVTRPSTLARREKLRRRVVAYIGQHPGCSGNDIQAGVGGHRDNFLRAVRDLIAEGTVIRTTGAPDRRVSRYELAAPPAGKTCERAGCGRTLPLARRRFCSDTCRARQQKAERVTETGEFGRAAVRMIRSMARRVGAADIAEFGAMWEVMTEAEHAVTTTVDDLRASGYSWAEIGAEIGWSKQRLSQWRQRRGEFGRQQSVYAGIPHSGAVG